MTASTKDIRQQSEQESKPMTVKDARVRIMRDKLVPLFIEWCDAGKPMRD